MDLFDQLRIILRHWWRILLVALTAAVAVHWMVGNQSSVYRTTASLSVTPGRSGADGAVAEDTTLFLTRTYAQLATTKPVADRAVVDGGLKISVDDVLAMISTDSSTNVGFLTITASTNSPKLAATVANAVAAALIVEVEERQARAVEKDLEAVNAELKQVEAQLAKQSDPASAQVGSLTSRYDALLQVAIERRANPLDRIEVLAGAEPPASRSSPNPTRDGLIAFIAAAILAAEGTVALMAFGGRIDGEDLESVSRLTGLPVLAVVPRGDGADVAEAFRSLRTSLYLRNDLKPPETMAIVSATANVGKSFTAIHFADALAGGFSGKRVLLVDADCRRPVLHERLGVRRAPGLTEALRGAPIDTVMVEVASPSGRHFDLIPSGRPVRDPAALIGGESFVRMIAGVNDLERLIIIDTPPVSLFGDPIAVATQCDATVLVIDAKASRKRQVLRTIEVLQRAGANMAGVIVNRAKADRSSRYY